MKILIKENWDNRFNKIRIINLAKRLFWELFSKFKIINGEYY